MANFLKLIEYHIQFLLNFIEFACDAPLPFGNLPKRLKQLLVQLQKVVGLPFKNFASGNSRIACKADHFSNIPLGELNLEKKLNGGEYKILFTVRGFYINEGLSNYTTFRPI